MMANFSKNTLIFFGFVLIYLSFTIAPATPSKILAILSFPLRSHNAIFQRYMHGLHARGHNLTVVAPYPPQQRYTSNYTFINSGTKDLSNTVVVHGQNVTGSLYQDFSVIVTGEIITCHDILGNADVRKLYSDDEIVFDVLIMEAFFVHCYLPIARAKNVPVVWYLAPSHMFAADLAIANVQNPSYFPTVSSRHYEFPVSGSPSFFSRLENFKNYLAFLLHHHFYSVPLSERICEEYFAGTKVPCDMDQLFKSVSLVLSNSHHILHRRATVPNHVGIGGLHVEPAKPLPSELRSLLDQSTKKVVYVSFGSLVKMSGVDDKLINAFLDAFATCDCLILWKSDLDTSANSVYRLPENVVIKKWFPQRDVLAHKKVKAFVSHGGLLSTYEAIYSATPVIGIPLMFDQFDNVRRMAELDVGIYLSYQEVSTGLKTAIREILNNSKFSENMNRLSKIIQDEPMSPLDKAVYWTEYVIRHNGSAHLRSSAADLYMYQDLLLDVIGATILLALVILYACSKLVPLAKRIVFGIIGRRNKVKKS